MTEVGEKDPPVRKLPREEWMKVAISNFIDIYVDVKSWGENMRDSNGKPLHNGEYTRVMQNLLRIILPNPYRSDKELEALIMYNLYDGVFFILSGWSIPRSHSNTPSIIHTITTPYKVETWFRFGIFHTERLIVVDGYHSAIGDLTLLKKMHPDYREK